METPYNIIIFILNKYYLIIHIFSFNNTLQYSNYQEL